MASDGTVVFPPEFRSIEEDFVERKMAINNSINEILSNDATSANAVRMAQADVVEAQRCMKMMSIEVRGKQPALRKAMQSKINLYRDELQGLLRDLERAQLMAREMKATSRSIDSDSQYNRITNNTNRFLKSSKTLESSRKLVAETEEIGTLDSCSCAPISPAAHSHVLTPGISVLDSLSQQRESLLSAHEKVRETKSLTGDARRILQRMTRRVLTNTIVLYTVIAILSISICYVLYHDFIKPAAALAS
ncbi:TPA: hypothetical protein N0F65_004655 [Lagenidium giganteum]|uniref:Vesicle transport v-SNARE N-terminal domain-containing protein n=1 Tax=Lagenidium giganteum TaxID=4803 RepID=A0AAV2ZE06_9STRA|nr:TPA: hypothetical protein N0F65_004655 [Lagenidium giganteum]